MQEVIFTFTPAFAHRLSSKGTPRTRFDTSSSSSSPVSTKYLPTPSYDISVCLPKTMKSLRNPRENHGTPSQHNADPRNYRNTCIHNIESNGLGHLDEYPHRLNQLLAVSDPTDKLSTPIERKTTFPPVLRTERSFGSANV